MQICIEISKKPDYRLSEPIVEYPKAKNAAFSARRQLLRKQRIERLSTNRVRNVAIMGVFATNIDAATVAVL